MTPQLESNQVIGWLKKVSDMETEFFKSVSVIPFGDMCFIYPKDMEKDKAIAKLKNIGECIVND